MKILALEFSSPQRSVAVVQPRGPLFTPETDEREASRGEGHSISIVEIIETGGRAAHALGMIEEALRQAQLEREQIECLAIGVGPGSYNGIRAAIALAQGWQLARSIRLLSVSSAECLAAQAQAEGVTSRVNVVIDAQRNEFYLASYEIGAQGRAEIQPLRLATLAEVLERQKAGELIIGPEVANWFPGNRVVFPRAATLGQLAWKRNDFVAGEKLTPIYLRETKFVKAPPSRKLGG